MNGGIGLIGSIQPGGIGSNSADSAFAKTWSYHMQVYTGELEDIQKLYPTTNSSNKNFIISKEHPAFNHYTGSKEEREWMFPTVTGYYSSFFGYWKNCQINLTN